MNAHDLNTLSKLKSAVTDAPATVQEVMARAGVAGVSSVTINRLLCSIEGIRPVLGETPGDLRWQLGERPACSGADDNSQKELFD